MKSILIKEIILQYWNANFPKIRIERGEIAEITTCQIGASLSDENHLGKDNERKKGKMERDRGVWEGREMEGKQRGRIVKRCIF